MQSFQKHMLFLNFKFVLNTIQYNATFIKKHVIFLEYNATTQYYSSLTLLVGELEIWTFLKAILFASVRNLTK